MRLSVRSKRMHGLFFLLLLLSPLLARAWEAPQVLRASNRGAGDYFGVSVSLSSNGLVMASGAWGEDSSSSSDPGDDSSQSTGAVYMFTRINEPDSPWSEVQYLKAPNPAFRGNFGQVVSLSGGGEVLAVSEPGAANVHLYQGTPSGSPANWTWVATLRASNSDPSDGFGHSVAVSPGGEIVVVGAPSESSASSVVNAGEADDSLPNAGAAYVFECTAPYMQMGYLKPFNPGADHFFGWAVDAPTAVSVLVSAYRENSSSVGVNGAPDTLFLNAGAAYLFDLEGSWQQTSYFKATNTGAGDQFGFAVAMRADTMVAGAFSEDTIEGQSGAVYVYHRNSSGWHPEAFLKASNAGNADRFGNALALSDDGQLLLAAAYLEDSDGAGVDPGPGTDTQTDSGAAYIFERAPGTGEWTEVAFLKATPPGLRDEFGVSVAVSGDAGVVCAGAWHADNGLGTLNETGAVYTFSAQPAPTLAPTSAPTTAPTRSPTTAPTSSPTPPPTPAPTTSPSASPTNAPTGLPTTSPTSSPTTRPTPAPSNAPSVSPTGAPTPPPTNAPTTLAPTASPTFASAVIVTGGTVINGSSLVTVPLQVVGGELTVNGDLNLEMGSNLTLSNSSTVIATGDVVVSGPLTLQLESAPMDGDVIQLVSGASVNGEFSEINLESEELDPCQKVVVTQQNPSGNSLSAVVSVDSSGCLNIPLIAGAVGGGVLLLAIIAIIVGVYLHKREERRMTEKLNIAMDRLQ